MTLVIIMYSNNTYHNCICPCLITSYNRLRNRVSSHPCTFNELKEDPVLNRQSLIFFPKLVFLVIFICM